MPTLYEYYNTGDDGSTYLRGAAWRAQTFTPSVAHTITSVKLLLYRYGAPGTITVSIRATDGSGHPTGADLCSGTTDGNTLPTSTPFEWREITFGVGYDLAASTKYAIVVRAPSGDTANMGRWRLDNTSPTYAGGIYESSEDSGSTWTTPANYDFMFEDWGEPLGVSVTIDVPLATVSSQAYAPTLSLDMTISPPVATVSSEALVPSLVRDAILDIPLALVSSEALVPSVIAGYGVIIDVPLAQVSSQALIPALSLGVTISPPVAEVTGEALIPALVRDAIVSIPLALVSSEALVPSLSLGVTIAIPLALVEAEALAPEFSLGIIIEVPLALVTAQALVPRVLFGRLLLAVRNLPAARTLASIREEEAL